MSALRVSRSAADPNAVTAAFQSAAASAFLPAAKSASSGAQISPSVAVPIDEQIGQASAAIEDGLDTGSWRGSPAKKPEATPALSTPSALTNRVERITNAVSAQRFARKALAS